MEENTGLKANQKRNHARKTIGLLIDWISTPYHVDILAGVQDFCEAEDINLICFVTGRLGSDWKSEKCRNIIADLASQKTVDGLLVCASSLQNFSGHEYLREFLVRYENLPMVTLHDSFPEIASVSIDNSAGITLLMDHLVKQHGYKRFAFLRGKEGNRDFDERYKSWRGYLARNNIPIDNECIVAGDYNPQAGIDAVRFLASRTDCFDALVCANDSMAFGALDEIKRLGLNIPVVGFDNVNMAYSASLTTVRQSITNQAQLAAGMLIRLIDREPVELEYHEQPLLIVRGSCGCKAHNSPPEYTTPDQLLDGEAKSNYLNEYDLEDLNNIGEKLFATLNREEELRVMTNEFPGMGIDGCCVSLYDDAADPLSTARLVAAYDGDRVYKVSREGIQFMTRSILPTGIMDTPKRKSLMIQSLFLGYEQIGLAVFSMSSRKWHIYEVLRRELSSALKGASLLESVQNHAQELEQQVKLRTRELEETNTRLKLEILERARIEAELARREEHYHDLALLLPTMVLEMDLHFQLTFINRAGIELLDLPDKETGRGESFMNYVHGDDSEYVEEMFTGIITQQRKASGEFRIISSSKKTISILFEANSIVKNGSLKGIRLSGINIGSMFSAAVQPEEILFKHYHFSPRVKEVLQLMLQGYSSKQIGVKLNISENTVKAHVRAIYSEMGVDNRSSMFKVLREYQVHSFGYQSYVFSMLSTLIKD